MYPHGISQYIRSRSKHPWTKHPMNFFENPEKTSHKDLPSRTQYPMQFLPPQTKRPMPFTTPWTIHTIFWDIFWQKTDTTSPAVFVTPNITSHVISAALDKTPHAIYDTLYHTSHFLGYFLAKQSGQINHPAFWSVSTGSMLLL